MKLTDLSRQEQLALGGLLRMLIRADGDFTEAEEEKLNALGESLGGSDLLWKVISDSAQAFANDAAITEAAAQVERADVRELIASTLDSLAASDGVDAKEAALVASLRAKWA